MLFYKMPNISFCNARIRKLQTLSIFSNICTQFNNKFYHISLLNFNFFFQQVFNLASNFTKRRNTYTPFHYRFPPPLLMIFRSQFKQIQSARVHSIAIGDLTVLRKQKLHASKIRLQDRLFLKKPQHTFKVSIVLSSSVRLLYYRTKKQPISFSFATRVQNIDNFAETFL